MGSPLLYVDTNVIMDAIEDRKNIFGNDIGTPAFKLFKEAISCKYHIIISAFTLYELRKKCKVDTTMFFEVIKQKRIHVGYDKEDETLLFSEDTRLFNIDSKGIMSKNSLVS